MRIGAFKAIAVALLVCACATGPAARNQAPFWPSLSRFSSEAELRAYIERAEATPPFELNHVRQSRGAWFTKRPSCGPKPYRCGEGEIIVTARRRDESGPSSITNVQTAGVDEGDVVKLYGRFLIVLQDGRLFSVDTGASSADLALVDRVNVYRDAHVRTWYDEVLIQDNRIVVTGYNYREDVTEFSVFSISADGRLTREGVYILSSQDYYNGENYATRLVDGNLVIYTQLSLREVDDVHWPAVRRWRAEGEAATEPERALFYARDIYRPIQPTREPFVHTLSVCPLGALRAGDELECRSTALVAPYGLLYVSQTHAYLWTVAGGEADRHDPCAQSDPDYFRSASAAALFQIPLAQDGLSAQFVRGVPYDQMSMDATADTFRALTVWIDLRCETNEKWRLPLRYMQADLSAFSDHPVMVPERNYTPLPTVGQSIENRFAEGYLIYGGRGTWASSAPDAEDFGAQAGPIVAVPDAAPASPILMQAPHSVVRVERVGDHAIVTGYRDGHGLSVSSIDLGAAPRIATTMVLPGRFESEGRSHAFNSTLRADGSALLGVATTEHQHDSDRSPSHSASSDVTFLTLGADGGLTSLGPLRSAAETDAAYHCEVSCIDWYGNSRAIFIGDRVFALSGTELIEGAVTDVAIEERARVNLTTPLPPR